MTTFIFVPLYLADMIRHLRAAERMARQPTLDGSDVRVAEMAAGVLAGQTAEIRRLRDIRARLSRPGPRTGERWC